MRESQLNVLQLVNATLSAAVFVALGEGLTRAFPEPLRGDGPSVSSIQTGFMAALLIVWTVKIFLDDHKTFAGADSKLASYADFFFTILSYLLLIASASAITNIGKSSEFLVLHFILLSIWVFSSIIFRLLGLEDKIYGLGSEEDYRLRLKWFGLNIVYGMIAWWISASAVHGDTMMPMAALLVVIILDAWNSNTFVGLAGETANPNRATE